MSRNKLFFQRTDSYQTEAEPALDEHGKTIPRVLSFGSANHEAPKLEDRDKQIAPMRYRAARPAGGDNKPPLPDSLIHRGIGGAGVFSGDSADQWIISEQNMRNQSRNPGSRFVLRNPPSIHPRDRERQASLSLSGSVSQGTAVSSATSGSGIAGGGSTGMGMSMGGARHWRPRDGSPLSMSPVPSPPEAASTRLLMSSPPSTKDSPFGGRRHIQGHPLDANMRAGPASHAADTPSSPFYSQQQHGKSPVMPTSLRLHPTSQIETPPQHLQHLQNQSRVRPRSEIHEGWERFGGGGRAERSFASRKVLSTDQIIQNFKRQRGMSSYNSQNIISVNAEADRRAHLVSLLISRKAKASNQEDEGATSSTVAAANSATAIEGGRGRKMKIKSVQPAPIRYTSKNVATKLDEAGATVCTEALAPWVQCNLCKKWRRVSLMAPVESFSSRWSCEDNTFFAPANQDQCRYIEAKLEAGEKILKPDEVDRLKTKEKERFYLQLQEFNMTCGIKMRKNPVLGGQELDLFRLYREITYMGGYEGANRNDGTWMRIFRGLINFNTRVTNASSRLKQAYKNFLLPYERAHMGDARGAVNASRFPPGNAVHLHRSFGFRQKDRHRLRNRGEIGNFTEPSPLLAMQSLQNVHPISDSSSGMGGLDSTSYYRRFSNPHPYSLPEHHGTQTTRDIEDMKYARGENSIYQHNYRHPNVQQPRMSEERRINQSSRYSPSEPRTMAMASRNWALQQHQQQRPMYEVTNQASTLSHPHTNSHINIPPGSLLPPDTRPLPSYPKSNKLRPYNPFTSRHQYYHSIPEIPQGDQKNTAHHLNPDLVNANPSISSSPNFRLDLDPNTDPKPKFSSRVSADQQSFILPRQQELRAQQPQQGLGVKEAGSGNTGALQRHVYERKDDHSISNVPVSTIQLQSHHDGYMPAAGRDHRQRTQNVGHGSHLDAMHIESGSRPFLASDSAAQISANNSALP